MDFCCFYFPLFCIHWLMGDYLSLGHTPRELVLMDEDNFLELYKRTFGPMDQIALNMGFETWKG